MVKQINSRIVSVDQMLADSERIASILHGLTRQKSDWHKEIIDYQLATIVGPQDNDQADKWKNCISWSDAGRLVIVYIHLYCFLMSVHSSQFRPDLTNSALSYQRHINFLMS
jgi:hypothetical protein